MKILLPSYFYATDKAWDALIESSSGQVIVILNPDNGPGDDVDEKYQKLCVRLRKARIGMLGYVATGWGKRDYLAVTEDLALWNVLYGLRDFFFDEAATSPDKLEYYKDLYNRVDGLVVLNPGTIPDEAYLECGDIIVVFESTYAKHTTAKFPAWFKRHPKKRFCQLVHTCPDAKSMKRAITKAAETSEFVYVTNDVLDNPWDMLPTYWKQELKACK